MSNNPPDIKAPDIKASKRRSKQDQSEEKCPIKY